MRLLIVTQKVDKDDSYFGFFHQWIEAFAKECEQVTVITLERRAYTLPPNVTIHSLGKEHGSSRLTRLFLFWKFIWKERREYDAAFCHMSPLYVITGYPVWHALGKKISLWYVHRHVDLKLRIAEKLADKIFTASPESFRLKSKKVHYMGQAVDAERLLSTGEIWHRSHTPSVLMVGRITPIKHLEILIEAIQLLVGQGRKVSATFVGAPLLASDIVYEASLRGRVERYGLSGSITFSGSMPFVHMHEAYRASWLGVNLAPTGGMDKVVLESLAAGTPVIVANKAFAPALRGYEERLIVREEDAQDLASKIDALLDAQDREEIGHVLQERIRTEYSLSALVTAIVAGIQMNI